MEILTNDHGIYIIKKIIDMINRDYFVTFGETIHRKDAKSAKQNKNIINHETHEIYEGEGRKAQGSGRKGRQKRDDGGQMTENRRQRSEPQKSEVRPAACRRHGQCNRA
jgi:hypothetical protein